MTQTKRTKSEATTAPKTAKKVHAAPASLEASAAPSQDQDASSSPLGKAPLYKERLGRVHLAIWAREDKSGTVRYSVKLTRSYKTETGFRDTSSLDQGDLAHAIALLTQAESVLPPLVVLEPQA